ncbi:hypothetical protein Syun_005231 [Stephania yunnanensis]|uniref:U-box domain-containing protein n=1 Tax=Stephania yunnanensis TaxID=152371 RepID=A0AAP0L816_9MAGN
MAETEIHHHHHQSTYAAYMISRTLISDDDPSSSSTSAFSDCNSDRSGEFSTDASSRARRRLLIACASSENSETLIRQLVSDLNSSSIESQRQAAMELRLLAKNKHENRLTIAREGAIQPLISLLSSPDPDLQEHGVTAILNLSLCEENKDLIAASGASNRSAGAIPLLVNLLESGGFRGKKDASTALYSLCAVKENKIRAVKSGIMRALVELMADFGSGMVDKAAFVLSELVSVREGRAAAVAEEGGVPVLVEMVEAGSQRQKEIASVVLLQICEERAEYRTMVAREGAIPPLVALTQTGTTKAKQKAEKLIELLRQPRSGNYGVAT